MYRILVTYNEANAKTVPLRYIRKRSEKECCAFYFGTLPYMSRQVLQMLKKSFLSI
jgi:hypothetical protein